MKTLRLSILLLGILTTNSLLAKTEEPIEQAREHVLEVTQQELEKGTISNQMANKIFELMDALIQLTPGLSSNQFRELIYITLNPDILGNTIECHFSPSADGAPTPACH